MSQSKGIAPCKLNMRPCGIKRRARANVGGYLALEKDKRKIQRNDGGKATVKARGKTNFIVLKKKG